MDILLLKGKEFVDECRAKTKNRQLLTKINIFKIVLMKYSYDKKNQYDVLDKLNPLIHLNRYLGNLVKILLEKQISEQKNMEKVKRLKPIKGGCELFPLDIKNRQIKIWDKYNPSDEVLIERLKEWTSCDNPIKALNGDFLNSYKYYVIRCKLKHPNSPFNFKYLLGILDLFKKVCNCEYETPKNLREYLNILKKYSSQFIKSDNPIFTEFIKMLEDILERKIVGGGDQLYKNIRNLIIKWVINEKKYEKEITEYKALFDDEKIYKMQELFLDI